MKKKTKFIRDTLSRSGRRLFATGDTGFKLAPIAAVDRGVEAFDHGGGGGDAEVNDDGCRNWVTESGNRTKEAMEIDDEEQAEFELGESVKVNANRSDETMGIDDYENDEQTEIKLGESKKLNRNGSGDIVAINDEQRKDIELGESKNIFLFDHNVYRNDRVRAIYTQKRRRPIPIDSSSTPTDFVKKYFRKKVRTSFQSDNPDPNLGFIRKNVTFIAPFTYNSISQFSCFVSSVLRYMRSAKFFSWSRFSSFLKADPATSVYLSTGIRVLQDSTCTTSPGFFKIFRSVLSIPLFTVDFGSLPFCFLYIHSSIYLRYAFRSSFPVIYPIEENVSEIDEVVVVRKARSGRKTVPRFSLFKKHSRKNAPALAQAQARVKIIVPVPGLREVAHYAEEEYVPFKRPKMYISSRSDELTRILKTGLPVYDMDSDDDEWLKKFNNKRLGNNKWVSDDTFETIIDAFERGIYCFPNDYSDIASAVDRCRNLASKEALEGVYSYWISKRKKKQSALVPVFQIWRKRVLWNPSNAIVRKKRSSRRRAGRLGLVNEIRFLKAILKEQKLLAEAAIAVLKVHEAQEAAKKSAAAALVKRQAAQASLQTADVVTYKATMAVRIADPRAAGHTHHFLLGE